MKRVYATVYRKWLVLARTLWAVLRFILLFFFFFFFVNYTATTEIYTQIARRQRQMCIRDSTRAARCTAGRNGSFVTSWKSFAWSPPRKAPIFEPVSYTHLRAHETVLDLVCRLLLLKKKKKNTMTIKQILPYRLNSTIMYLCQLFTVSCIA